MKFDAFDKAMRALPGVTLDIKWETHRTFCVGEKMFVMAGDLGDEEPRYMFKASELGFEMLVESGAAVPAPYLGHAKWVIMTAPESLEDADLMAYAQQAHALVAAKLPKRVRAGLGIAG
jgi:predicted DNA-binding protein (MmcQ/YjbR family)